MKNKLIVIGVMSDKTCYLNITREEAIKRYLSEEGNEYMADEVQKEDSPYYDEFEFDDKFYAYHAFGP